jgi:hypothetical protein
VTTDSDAYPHDMLHVPTQRPPYSSHKAGTSMKQIHSDLWITDTPLRFVGVEVGARMTVIRLPDSKLVLHSPIAAMPELVSEVQALGTVAYIISPNKFHHLFIDQWKKACPDASVYVAPGLDTKRSDLDIAAVLTDGPEPGWAETLDQVLVAGFSLVNEVVFFHRPSKTLIATDLVFNIGPSSPGPTRFAFRFIGSTGRVAPTLLERLFVRDRAAFRRSLERILEWPFERIVMSHGDVSESGGRAELVDGYGWVLGGK